MLLISTNVQILLFSTDDSVEVNAVLIEILIYKLILYLDNRVVVLVAVSIIIDSANIDTVYYFLSYRIDIN